MKGVYSARRIRVAAVVSLVFVSALLALGSGPALAKAKPKPKPKPVPAKNLPVVPAANTWPSATR